MTSDSRRLLSSSLARLGSIHIVGGLLALGLGLIVLHQAQGFTRMGSHMPNLVGVLLIAFGGALCLVHLLGLVRIADPEKAEGGIPIKLVFIALMGLWVAAMPILGFLTSSLLGFFAVALLVPRQRWRLASALLEMLCGAALIIAIYLLATRFLDMAFPRGMLI